MTVRGKPETHFHHLVRSDPVALQAVAFVRVQTRRTGPWPCLLHVHQGEGRTMSRLRRASVVVVHQITGPGKVDKPRCARADRRPCDIAQGQNRSRRSREMREGLAATAAFGPIGNLPCQRTQPRLMADQHNRHHIIRQRAQPGRPITGLFANARINVLSINTQTNKKRHTATMRLRVEVPNLGALSKLLERINRLKNVISAVRVSE